MEKGTKYQLKRAARAFANHETCRQIVRTMVMVSLLAIWFGEQGTGEEMPQGGNDGQKKQWPIWDGKETVAQYAKRAMLKPTLTLELNDGVKLEMVLVPAGKFMMGSDKGNVNERPVHKVTISKPFYMGKYEVTQEQWQLVMGDNSSVNQNPKNPVDRVNWKDCQDFLKKLNDKTGRKFVLPTEAEWEYSCRAGSTTEYCFGNDETRLGEYAWYGPNLPTRRYPVGQRKPNAWGLYDMHGNACEWCQDWYGSYQGGDQNDPQGPVRGNDHVRRGGSCFDSAAAHRSAWRDEPYVPMQAWAPTSLRLALREIYVSRRAESEETK